jgi:hypothetical protein
VNMRTSLRRWWYRSASATTLMLLALFPVSVSSLTTGPAQPEFRAFTPPGTTDLVDLFTGDFQYSIPLFELPGPNGSYQFTLGYRSGASSEDEASWVGLGWSLNPGMISRQMRGLPDDFGNSGDGQDTDPKGASDRVKTTIQMLPSNTYGLRFGGSYELFGSDFLAATAESQLYYNTKRGFGIKNSIGLSASFSGQYGLAGQVGVNLSNEDGVSASASLSVGQDAHAAANAAYNSRTGLQTLNLSAGYKGHTGGVTKDFGKPTELPDSGFSTHGYDVQVAVKGGGEIQGSFLNLFGGGFLNGHNISQQDQSGLSVGAYGYIYMHEATDDDVIDFNREKDGQIHDNTPNLATPVLTSDVFTIATNGLNGAFRAFRSDVPILRDRRQVSTQQGTSIEAEFGGGTWAHGGAGQVVTVGNTTVSGWGGGEQNELVRQIGDVNTELSNSGAFYEPVYFKMIGEQSSTSRAAGVSLASIGEERPVRPTLQPTGVDDWKDALLDFEAPIFHRATSDLVFSRSDEKAENWKNLSLTSTDRMPRGTLIEAFTREEVRRSCTNRTAPSDTPVSLAPLREFCGEHAIGVNINEDPHRRNKHHHIAGFRVTRPDGTRYIFGLAAYNIEHEEHEISVDRTQRRSEASCLLNDPPPDDEYKYQRNIAQTDKYLRIRTVSPYATSYLLTAILGPDYVDADDTPGVSSGDLGHFVAFRYERTTQNYQWRAPFYGARFMRGYENGRTRTDRATFVWGKKELWYLVKAETRTHEVVFDLDKDYTSRLTDVSDYPNSANRRRDARGVHQRLQRSDTQLGEASAALRRISLYAKPAIGEPRSAPIKTVTLIYDYSLAHNSPNTLPSSAADAKTYEGRQGNDVNKGKLSLKRLEETYRDDSKGRRSAYEFIYGYNPNYQEGGQDRWGSYRDLRAQLPNTIDCNALTSAQEALLRHSFTPQDAASANARTLSARAWNISEVIEPSGRRVLLEYEMDDYAYVQDKIPARAVPLLCEDGTASSSCPVGCAGDRCRIQVRVPLPLPGGVTQAAHNAAFKQRYLPSNGQIYFRARLNLGGSRGWETVSGYAEVDDVEMLDTPIDPPATDYLFRLILKRVDEKHPLRLAAWQHLRLQQPDLLSNRNFPAQVTDIGGMAQAVTEAAKVLTGIDLIEAALDELGGIESDVGTRIDASGPSWVKLRVPIGSLGTSNLPGKYGGGSRVRRIIFNDGWKESAAADQCIETGWVYRYKLTDGIQSSGVAANEPSEGAEENSLRVAKIFAESLPLATDYNLFFEKPINEAYFPAPVVGYSRVEVESLAADSRRRGVRRHCGVEDPWPAGADAFVAHPTTGITVYEFYTARDFPVKSDDTDLAKKSTSFFIPIVFIGPVSFNDITLSQGYSVVLNDMHGKEKRITHYQHKKLIDSYDIDWENEADEFVRRTTYYYKAKTNSGGGATNELSPWASVLTGENAATPAIFGRAEEFFVDARQHEQAAWTVGVKVNLDLIAAGFVPLPIVVPWPSIGYSATRARTVVTNKVVYQSGILDRIENERGTLRVVQRPLKLDPNSGQTLLETTTNEFDDPIYTYRQPAYWAYQAMGPGYRSSKLALTATERTEDGTDGFVISDVEPDLVARIRVGDEFEIREGTAPVSTAVVASVDGRNVGFRVAGPRPGNAFDLLLVRPGTRNQTAIIAGEIRSLADPLAAANRSAFGCPPESERVICGKCFETVDHKRPSDELIGILVKAGFKVDGKEKKPGMLEQLGAGQYEKTTFGAVEIRKRVILVRMEKPAKRSCAIEFRDRTGMLIDADDIVRVLKWREATSPGGAVPSGMRDVGLVVVVQLKNGKSIEARLFSNCPALTQTVQVVVASPKFCTKEHQDSLTQIKDVLSARATEFSEDWLESREDIRLSEARLALLESWDPHLNGKRGIWRPEKFHEYVKERRPSGPSVMANRRTDGAIDGLLMFPWSDPTLIASCAPDWKLSRQVTRYSPYGHELETNNAIGVKSTALYGFRASVPIAVAVNASQNEVGSDGFEEYPDGIINLVGAPSGNLVFGAPKSGKPDFTGIRVEVVEALICGNFARPLNPEYALQGRRTFSALKSGVYGHTAQQLLEGGAGLEFIGFPHTSCPRMALSITYPEELHGDPLLAGGAIVPDCEIGGPQTRPPPVEPDIPHCTGWEKGKIVIGIRDRPGVSGKTPPAAPQVTRTKAHTGRRSLLVSSTTDDFRQPYLNLITDRSYVISAWVSRDNVDMPTLRSTGTLPVAERIGIRVTFLDGMAVPIGDPILLEPGGPVIEGWQQINGMLPGFPQGTASISIALQNGKQLRRAGNTTVEEFKPAYFDDIRIFPETGNIETYVYDPLDYRLTASLDKNNFATLFTYQADGTLSLIRKETVRGVQTVRETRFSLRNRAPPAPGL